MNELTEEDKYLLSKGIDPYYDGATQPIPMDSTDDELLKVLAARDEFKRMQYKNLGGGDMYYEMQQPTPDRRKMEDALLMEMINEGY